MDQNVGNLDRILRLGAGITLIVLSATGYIGVWGWFGVVPLLTGLSARCPAYTLFGIKTCKTA